MPTEQTDQQPRQYAEYNSHPTYLSGACPACKSLLPLDSTLPFDDDQSMNCEHCGRVSTRQALIFEVLAQKDVITWSLFGCDCLIGEELQLGLNDYAYYKLPTHVKKWLHLEIAPNETPGTRYVANVAEADMDTIYIDIKDTAAYASPPEDPPPTIDVTWYRFGLADLNAVPPWRQSLFGAATLLVENPSAAIVLIAAGFEAFFAEFMRIRWIEQGLDIKAFEHLMDRPQPISSLVDWLPASVGVPTLREGPADLRKDWGQLVNTRRNYVVHRANVNITSLEAFESLRVALKTIMFFDRFALTRPHVYYLAP